MNKLKGTLAALGCATLVVGGSGGASAAPVVESANGHGTLLVQNDNGDTVKRQFSFNAKKDADGTVTGQAQLVNKAFSGADTPAPYRLHIDISCMQTFGNIAFFGGTVKSTNDPGLNDAVYFSVQDNGEPGDQDRISRTFFYDDDPGTTGSPDLCLGNEPGDFPTEPIDGGTIQVRPAGP